MSREINGTWRCSSSFHFNHSSTPALFPIILHSVAGCGADLVANELLEIQCSPQVGVQMRNGHAAAEDPTLALVSFRMLNGLFEASVFNMMPL